MAKFRDYLDYQIHNIQMQMDRPVYCRFCGDDVRKPRMGDKDNWNEHMAWMVENRSHIDCFQNNQGGMYT